MTRFFEDVSQYMRGMSASCRSGQERSYPLLPLNHQGVDSGSSQSKVFDEESISRRKSFPQMTTGAVKQIGDDVDCRQHSSAGIGFRF